MDQATKEAVITDYRRHEDDTGSAEVQVALLTERIQELSRHFTEHKHDNTGRRGLLMLVGQRRRLLRYLEREDTPRYRDIISRLRIRLINTGGTTFSLTQFHIKKSTKSIVCSGVCLHQI